MVPISLKLKLAGLSLRERLLRGAWGMARVLAVVAAVLAVACGIDWLIDRFQDTPFWIRVVLFVGQVVGASVALYFFVARPLLERFTLSRLALMVEDKHPQLDHRLISAVEFNQPGARTEGMSKELIEATTQQSLAATRGLSFAAAADHARLKWAGIAVAPVLVIGALALVLMPEMLMVLLGRQLLAPFEIPRRVYLKDLTPFPFTPSNEDTYIVFVARFRYGLPEDKPQGVLYTVAKTGQSRDAYPLTFKEVDPSDPNSAIYTAKVPASAADFYYSARLDDGRSKNNPLPLMTYEPRPGIQRQEALVELPEKTLGLRPDNKPYSVAMSQGEIACPPRLHARVQATLNKEIKDSQLKNAQLQVVGYLPMNVDLSLPTGETAPLRAKTLSLFAASSAGLGAISELGPVLACDNLSRGRSDLPLSELPLSERKFAPVHIRKPGREANEFTFVPKQVKGLDGAMTDDPAEKVQLEWVFDLRPNETGYRIVVLDDYDWLNKDKGARSIALIPERAPSVALLRERFPPMEGVSPGQADDFEVDGMPLPMQANGKPDRIRMAYRAEGPYGLGEAYLRFRPLKRTEGSQQEKENQPIPGEEKWQTLSLIRIEKGDLFDSSTGAFYSSSDKDQVQFHAVDMRRLPKTLIGEAAWFAIPRTLGGGRFDWHPANLLDDNRTPVNLQIGDQVEYYIEVESLMNPNMRGRSETRTKTIVSQADFRRWGWDTVQEEGRIRRLESLQRGVFDGK